MGQLHRAAVMHCSRETGPMHDCGLSPCPGQTENMPGTCMCAQDQWAGWRREGAHGVSRPCRVYSLLSLPLPKRAEVRPTSLRTGCVSLSAACLS